MEFFTKQFPNQWGSLIPIWGWDFWVVYLFALFIDFGMIILIRGLLEGRWYLSRWWSFKVGDVIGLPVYMAFASFVLKNSYHEDAFYTWWWVQLVLLAAGYAVWIWIQRDNLNKGKTTIEVVCNPSELYHTFIYGVMFYLIASSITPLLMDHNPTRETVFAMLGLGVWFVCVGIDSSPLQKNGPEHDRKAIWEMSWWPWKKEVDEDSAIRGLF